MVGGGRREVVGVEERVVGVEESGGGGMEERAVKVIPT